MGRVIVAHKKHVSEITELSKEERAAYIEDINHVSDVINSPCIMHGEFFIYNILFLK